MENKIKLNLTKNDYLELDSHTPNMQNMIDEIVRLRDIIEVNEISVEVGENTEFDKDGFIKMMKEIIGNYLEQIRLNDAYLSENKKSINEKCKELQKG